MNHFSFSKTFLIAAVATTSLTAQAETHHLDPLFVTVTTPLRIAQPLGETLAATRVITRAEIERRQPESLAQLLRGLPGIEFASNGGAGSQTSLFLRGSNSNHTLVLIDGVKANSPIDGSVRWEFLPVSQIERIEIVRGPQSSVWGADAIGGVVNIITRKAAVAGTQGEIRVGAGQQNTQLTDASFSASQDATRLNSALSYRKSDGFNATQADSSGEKDGFEHYALRLQVEQDLDERNTLSAGYLRSQGTNEYDDPCPFDLKTYTCFPVDPHMKQNFTLETFNVGWQHQLSEFWILDSSLQRLSDDRRDYKAGLPNGHVKTQRDQLGFKASLGKTHYSLVTGIDIQKERLQKTESHNRDRREIYGIFTQTQHKLTDAWTFSAGARLDNDEFFGEKATGNLGLSWKVNDTHTFGATISQGYRAPNLTDLYGPIDWGANPNLRPEKSINYETFWQYQLDTFLSSEVRLFQNEIDNLIIGDAQNSFLLSNISEARIRGAELSLNYLLDNWVFKGSLTVQDPINRDTDKLLLRRSREQGRFDVDYATHLWGVGITTEGQAKRYDPSGRMGGYVLLHTRAHWNLAPNWILRAKVDNLLDKDYEQTLDVLSQRYNTPGRYFETSLTYRF